MKFINLLKAVLVIIIGLFVLGILFGAGQALTDILIDAIVITVVAIICGKVILKIFM